MAAPEAPAQRAAPSHPLDNPWMPRLFALSLMGFLLLGVLYAALTPPWQSPDEPAHYNYIAYLGQEGCCPAITEQDWDAAYLEELKAGGFPEGADLSQISYEDHQPPLYYLMLWPVYLLGGRDVEDRLLTLRVASVSLGAGAVLLTFVAGLILLPTRPQLAAAAAILAGFVPQFVAIMASVNNDSLAMFSLMLVITGCLIYLGNPAGGEPPSPYDVQLPGEDVPYLRQARPAVLGVLVGIAYLTKLTVYLPATLAVAAAILVRRHIEKRPLVWVVDQAAQAGGIALVMGLLWWARNTLIYGWPDFFGLTAHDAVVTGQPRTAEFIAASGLGPHLLDMFRVTFNSFWGQFGWMGVPMQWWAYAGIGVFVLVSAAGGALLALEAPERFRLHPQQVGGLIVLGAAALGTLIGFGYYNVNFVQFQGRYLFPLLPGFALMIVLGYHGWALFLMRRLPRWAEVLNWLPVIAVSWLPPFALFALIRFIVPNLE